MSRLYSSLRFHSEVMTEMWKQVWTFLFAVWESVDRDFVLTGERSINSVMFLQETSLKSSQEANRWLLRWPWLKFFLKPHNERSGSWAEIQNPGGGTQRKTDAASEVFPEWEWLNILPERTRMSHKWDEPSRGSISSVSGEFFYYLFRELFMSLKEYNHSLFSFIVAFNSLQSTWCRSSEMSLSLPWQNPEDKEVFIRVSVVPVLHSGAAAPLV